VRSGPVGFEDSALMAVSSHHRDNHWVGLAAAG
jgi:hypothetical protein